MLAKSLYCQIACLLLAFTTTASAQEGLVWEQDFEAARHKAASSGRLLLVHFYGPACPPCAELERNVFSQPGFGRELSRDFVAVKVDGIAFPALARQLKVHQWPTDVVLSPRDEVLDRYSSPRSEVAYVGALTRIAANVRRTQTAQQYVDRGTPAASPGDRYPLDDRSTAVAGVNRSMPAVQEHSRYVDPANYQEPNDPRSGANHQPMSAQTAGRAAQAPRAADRYDVSGYRRDEQAPASVPTVARSAPAIDYRDGQAPGFDGQNRAAEPRNYREQQAPLASAPPSRQQAARPSANPPIALDSFCPVALVEQRGWVRGDVRWGAIHRDRTYLFSSADAQAQFLKNPDRFAPVMSGNDPVLALDANQTMAGHRKYGLFFENRIFLFSSEDTLATFSQNPQRYLQETAQAMLPRETR